MKETENTQLYKIKARGMRTEVEIRHYTLMERNQLIPKTSYTIVMRV